MEEIFQTFLTATSEELKGAADKLKEMTPSPMNSMLEKEPISDAIKKRNDRSKKIVEDVPPTTPLTPGMKVHILLLLVGEGGREEKISVAIRQTAFHPFTRGGLSTTEGNSQ